MCIQQYQKQLNSNNSIVDILFFIHSMWMCALSISIHLWCCWLQIAFYIRTQEKIPKTNEWKKNVNGKKEVLLQPATYTCCIDWKISSVYGSANWCGRCLLHFFFVSKCHKNCIIKCICLGNGKNWKIFRMFWGINWSFRGHKIGIFFSLFLRCLQEFLTLKLTPDYCHKSQSLSLQYSIFAASQHSKTYHVHFLLTFQMWIFFLYWEKKSPPSTIQSNTCNSIEMNMNDWTGWSFFILHTKKKSYRMGKGKVTDLAYNMIW